MFAKYINKDNNSNNTTIVRILTTVIIIAIEMIIITITIVIITITIKVIIVEIKAIVILIMLTITMMTISKIKMVYYSNISFVHIDVQVNLNLQLGHSQLFCSANLKVKSLTERIWILIPTLNFCLQPQC